MVVSSTCVGIRHRHYDKDNQDYTETYRDENVEILAVADGVSAVSQARFSAEVSARCLIEVGKNITSYVSVNPKANQKPKVNGFLNTLKKTGIQFEETEKPEENPYIFDEERFKADLAAKFRSEFSASPYTPDELGATASMVVKIPSLNSVLGVAIGDCSTVYFAKDGNWYYLTTGEKEDLYKAPNCPYTTDASDVEKHILTAFIPCTNVKAVFAHSDGANAQFNQTNREQLKALLLKTSVDIGYAKWTLDEMVKEIADTQNGEFLNDDVTLGFVTIEPVDRTVAEKYLSSDETYRRIYIEGEPAPWDGEIKVVPQPIPGNKEIKVDKPQETFRPQANVSYTGTTSLKEFLVIPRSFYELCQNGYVTEASFIDVMRPLILSGHVKVTSDGRYVNS